MYLLGEKRRAGAKDTKSYGGVSFFHGALGDWHRRREKEDASRDCGAIIAIGEIVGQLSRWQFYSPCTVRGLCKSENLPRTERRSGREGKEILEHVFATFGARYRENLRWKVGPVDDDPLKIKVEKPREILATRPRTKNRCSRWDKSRERWKKRERRSAENDTRILFKIRDMLEWIRFWTDQWIPFYLEKYIIILFYLWTKWHFYIFFANF